MPKSEFPKLNGWIHRGWIWDEFHPIYLSHLGYGIHVYYFTKFSYVNGMKFHFTKEWNVRDVFNPTGRYELHLKDRMFLYVIFWHLRNVFNLKGGYELHPKDRMFLLVIFWLLRGVFNLRRYKFHPKERMFLYVIFWHLGDDLGVGFFMSLKDFTTI